MWSARQPAFSPWQLFKSSTRTTVLKKFLSPFFGLVILLKTSNGKMGPGKPSVDESLCMELWFPCYLDQVFELRLHLCWSCGHLLVYDPFVNLWRTKKPSEGCTNVRSEVRSYLTDGTACEYVARIVVFQTTFTNGVKTLPKLLRHRDVIDWGTRAKQLVVLQGLRPRVPLVLCTSYSFRKGHLSLQFKVTSCSCSYAHLYKDTFCKRKWLSATGMAHGQFVSHMQHGLVSWHWLLPVRHMRHHLTFEWRANISSRNSFLVVAGARATSLARTRWIPSRCTQVENVAIIPRFRCNLTLWQGNLTVHDVTDLSKRKWISTLNVKREEIG